MTLRVRGEKRESTALIHCGIFVSFGKGAKQPLNVQCSILTIFCLLLLYLMVQCVFRFSNLVGDVIAFHIEIKSTIVTKYLEFDEY